ncbi:hypothetical protein D6825_02215 [Candidatus Woesearchaeota archaeon]|nr:MAG: hypothetical protein D6825_02215 [Candidatus Woesearchaeota archaeon]
MLSRIIGFIASPEKMLFVVVCTIFALAALLAFNRSGRLSFLYAHLVFVLSPVFYFALSINCSFGFAKGLLSWCTLLFAKFIIYVLPPLIAAVVIGGAFFVPMLLRASSRAVNSSIFRSAQRKAGVKSRLFVIDRAAPQAFSSGGDVFASVGLFDVLSKDELEAVFLHELHHVKKRASWRKLSDRLVRFFSPLAWFSKGCVESDEIEADEFAIRIQGTRAHIDSARLRIASHPDKSL